MSEDGSYRSTAPRFSLLSLLAITAVIAIGAAVVSAYRTNRSMVQKRDELLTVSNRARVDDGAGLASSEIPKVADDFQSWNIDVPNGRHYELRLGLGEVSENGIPADVSGVPLAAGQHRVTLETGDTPNEEFRYVVYVDGEQAIEKTMGKGWIPGGWSSSSGMNWPREPALTPAPLQLSARSYKPKLEFGNGNGRYFNGQSDNFVTRKGYRLWMEAPKRAHPPASQFIGLRGDPNYLGIGLRDGLRFRPNGLLPYEWTFTRPALETDQPVLRISAAFFTSDGSVLSSKTQSFQSWELRDDAQGQNALSWQANPAQSEYSAFLHAKLISSDSPQPVIEVKWDSSRADEVALRLADVPANDRVTRWRLRILDGSDHLWRVLQFGDKTISAETFGKDVTSPAGTTIPLDLEDSGAKSAILKWRSKETLPLQIVERTQRDYAGLGLYQGLPVSFEMEIPATMKPTIKVNPLDKDPKALNSGFPGGPVFDELEIEFEPARHDWIWLEAKPVK